jgi:hypothetical protein
MEVNLKIVLFGLCIVAVTKSVVPAGLAVVGFI